MPVVSGSNTPSKQIKEAFMKVLKFRICTQSNIGTADSPEIVESFADGKLRWSEENEAVAKKLAYNGEYTIEDDGEPEPAPTQLDRIEAQTTYTAMMTDTLLEG
jgi:hypothetical protein